MFDWSEEIVNIEHDMKKAMALLLASKFDESAVVMNKIAKTATTIAISLEQKAR